MKSSISSLFRSVTTRQSVGWSASTVLHATGVLVAWMTFSGESMTEPPKLPGSVTRIALAATWVEPEVSSRPDETVPIDAQVLVMPDRAEVADRTFRHASTNVSQPSPDEQAMVEQMLTLPSPMARRRGPVAHVDRLHTDLPSATPIERRPAVVSLPATRAEASPSEPRRSVVGTEDRTLPRLLGNRPPTYPARALLQRLEGKVLLKVHVTADGSVAGLRVVASSGHPILDAAAVRAVRNWRFEPARRRGEGVAATIRLPVRFALD